METDAATVAAGLTAAQRKAAVSTWDGDYRMSQVLASLVQLGVFKEVRLGGRSKLRHTGFGLAVRRELERNGK